MAEWDIIRDTLTVMRSGTTSKTVLFICDVYIDFLSYVKRKYHYATLDGPGHIRVWYEYIEEIKKFAKACKRNK